MWKVSGNNLQMTEGDFGIKLPVEIQGTTLGENDSIRITIKPAPDGDELVVKDFTGIVMNTVELELTEQESALLSVGDYVYALDWYQSGSFMCNIIEVGLFKVVNKA